MLSGATVALAGFRSCAGCSRFRFSLYLLLAACNLNTMERRRKLNIFQKSGQSQSNGQLIDSCSELNQSDSSILEENAQFGGDDQLQSEQQMQEESHTESYTSFDSTNKSSS